MNLDLNKIQKLAEELRDLISNYEGEYILNIVLSEKQYQEYTNNNSFEKYLEINPTLPMYVDLPNKKLPMIKYVNSKVTVNITQTKHDLLR